MWVKEILATVSYYIWFLYRGRQESLFLIQSVTYFPASRIRDCRERGTGDEFVISDYKARFKRRILHVPNLMQMSENNRYFSFALDSAHVKCDV